MIQLHGCITMRMYEDIGEGMGAQHSCRIMFQFNNGELRCSHGCSTEHDHMWRPGSSCQGYKAVAPMRQSSAPSHQTLVSMSFWGTLPESPGMTKFRSASTTVMRPSLRAVAARPFTMFQYRAGRQPAGTLLERWMTWNLCRSKRLDSSWQI